MSMTAAKSKMWHDNLRNPEDWENIQIKKGFAPLL